MRKAYFILILLLCSSCLLQGSGSEDIDLYGVVIDQHGKPVAGATVRFDASGYFLGAGAGTGARLTDKLGRFVIETEGGAVTIHGIDHPQVDQLKLPVREGEWEKTAVTFYGHQRVAGGNEYLWRNYTNDRPFVFRVWRIQEGDTEGVLESEVFFSPEPDARTYTVDLAANFGQGKIVEGTGREGQLRIRFFRANEEGVDYSRKKNFGARLDWWVELSAIDGGLMPVAEDDPYINLAPETGYRPSIRIEMSLDDDDYQREVRKRRYYYKARDGKYYGVVVADFYSISRGDPLVRLGHKINVLGRRQLVSRR